VESIVKSYQDYQLIEAEVQKYVDDYGDKYKFSELSNGFLFFILERIFDLQEDEAYNAITDTQFITRQKNYNNEQDHPHDKGIDAIIIDEENRVVHLLNFKYYKNGYEKVKDKSFESGEIPKVKSILKDLFERHIPTNANPPLKEKLEEIFLLQDKGIRFTFKIHFIANIYKGFTLDEETEFKNHLDIDYNGDVVFDNISINHIVNKLIMKPEKLNAKFKISGRNFFEKSQYGHRALIAEIYAKDLLRIILNDEELRNNIEANDSDIRDCLINENIFEDNVRVYLKQRSSINKNIKKTASDEDESNKFFFYNNGITITCDTFDYQGKLSPLINLFGLQVVNGSQTLHSLKEAFDELGDDSENFDDISLLCRIYETKDTEFKSKIAEYTNNQNPVSNRDVRSIDIIQIKLEKELLAKGYYYERKRNQHQDVAKEERIDAEKFGQAYLAFYLNMPGEAKNKKSIIFSTKYDEIFNSQLSADIILECLVIYNYIEEQKLLMNHDKAFLNHSTYYIMYFISLIKKKELDKNLEEWYMIAIDYIEKIREKEKLKLSDEFSDAVLFKGNTPKTYMSEFNLNDE